MDSGNLCHVSVIPVWLVFVDGAGDYIDRPVAMGWHGVANATPKQEDTRFLPPLHIFLQLKI